VCYTGENIACYSEIFWSALQIIKHLAQELNAPSIKLGLWKFRLIVEPEAYNTLQVKFIQMITGTGNVVLLDM